MVTFSPCAKTQGVVQWGLVHVEATITKLLILYCDPLSTSIIYVAATGRNKHYSVSN